MILDTWHGFEYTTGIKYAGAMNMMRFSYNYIIVIVTNVVTLESLSAWFVHSSPPKLTNLIFFNMS